MKNSFILHSFIVFLLLALYVLSSHMSLLHRQHYYNQIKELTIICFSYDYASLEEIGASLLGKPTVSSVSWGKNVDILKEMVDTYELHAAEELADLTLLPNKLELKLEGDLFDRASRHLFLPKGPKLSSDDQSYARTIDGIKSHLREKDPNLIVLSPDEEYIYYTELLRHNRLIDDVIAYGFGLLLLVITVLLRRESMIKENRMWNKYRKIGGTKKRLPHLLLQNLCFVLLPVLMLKAGIYLGQKHFLEINYLAYETWLTIIGILMLSSGIAWVMAINTDS
jgi:hypothetical protein